MIMDNTINNCTRSGITVFGSQGDIYRNHISSNLYGVWLADHSSMSLYGSSSAQTQAQTQEIMDNELYEVYASQYSFPENFHYNVIIDEDNLGAPTDPMIYCITSIGLPLDASYNCWGANFNPVEDFHPGSCIWNPTWCPSGESEGLEAAAMYETANTMFFEEEYYEATETFKTLVDQYPQSEYARAAMNDLFAIEQFTEANYDGLKDYYSSNSSIQSDSILAATGTHLSTKCDIKLENWSSAIEYYESIILYPESLEDSIFAIINLGYVYFVMENSGYKSACTGALVQYKPDSKEQFFGNRNSLLSLLPREQSDGTSKEGISVYLEVELLQNVPNPFTECTQILYNLSQESIVQLNIYNCTGQLISSINEGTKTKGTHCANFDASWLKNGIYFYSISVNGKTTDSKKMSIIK